MADDFSTAELEAYLDESLSTERMAAIEASLRNDPKLLGRLVAINARRDAGVHSLGEVWRRSRLTCFNREQLGSYLLGVMPAEQAAYLKFHIEVVGCRLCQANLDDLESQRSDKSQGAERRRQKFFKSSAGRLPGTDSSC